MKKLITYFVVLFTGTSIAQQLPSHNQYLVNDYSLSPAYAGNNKGIESFLGYRQLWVGVPGAPKTTLANFNGAIPDKDMGVGLRLESNQIGIFRNVSVSADYAYHLKLNEEHTINLAAGVGMEQNSIDFGTQDAGVDEVLMTNQNLKSTGLRASFAFLYKFKDLNVGFYAPRILENEVKDVTTVYKEARHYMAHVSYPFTVKRMVQVEPHAIIRMTQNSPLFYEMAFIAKYQGQVWLGSGYRKGSSIAVHAGGMVYNKFALNYSYEFSGGGIAGASSGSHEVSLGFLLSKSTDAPRSVFSKKDAGSTPYINFIDE